MSDLPYFLGCPIWSNPEWSGSLYTRKASRAEYLEQYSQVFNTVEVSSTFYAIPPVDTVRRWANAVAPGFRFCLKFPRAISHEKRLRNSGFETEAFLELVEVLAEGDCLGPSFLQLGPDFSAKQFSHLVQYLDQLPDRYPYAVEVRHADYFDERQHETALNQLLEERNIDRVLLDSRALFSAPPTTDAEHVSYGRKPRVPVRFNTTGHCPLVRLIGRDDPPSLLPWIEEWSKVASGWLAEGKTPYIFTHTPNDLFAPSFGRLFHEVLKRKTKLPNLSDWPGEVEPQPPKQLSLFDE